MIEVTLGENVLLDLTITDGDVTKFPRAEIFDDGGAFVAFVSLASVGNGTYQGQWLAPAAGAFSASLVVYEDALHVTPSDPKQFGRASEHIRVASSTLGPADVTLVAGAVWDAASPSYVVDGSMGQAVSASAADAGRNTILDGGAGQPNIPHSGNNNLIGARLRVFASKLLADSATLGSADGADGEFMTLFFDSASYVGGNPLAVAEQLASTKRTAS